MSASRVRQELDELREKHLTSHQRDKYKDFTSRLTTPEEAKAFLASMRDKQKAATDATPKPPAHLTADGMDAWYLQQRERERLERERRKEAEALLRGYRMTMSHDKSRVTSRGREETSDLSTLREHLFDSGDMTTITENMDDREVEEERREVGRLSIDESVFRLSQHHYDREVGRLGLGAVGRESEEFTGGGTATHSGGSGNEKSAEEFTNGERAGTSVIEDASRDLKTPQKDEENKMEGEESEYENERKPPHSCRKFKGVPTPAKNLFPDETEWRDFVSSEVGEPFPPEIGRYHIYASYACPGSHRALIVRALKGLEDVVSVTIVHPTWRLTKGSKNEGKEQRGWVFGDPEGEPFANTAGRGGPFPPAFSDNEPDPIFNAFSIREIYEHAGDTAGKYTVPILWDKKLNTIVNNESSDIAYMLNSRFNDFAKNPDLDLYTEDDPTTLNEAIEWLAPLMIHGVYRCGFAKSQTAYEKAINELTETFDRADAVLQRRRFLTGDTLTDADIRLFVTLFRFDEVYAFYFRANSRLVLLTPSLLNYCRDIYQMEGVAPTCNMDHIKAHFYASHAEWNKFSIIPRGLGFTALLEQPHNRDEISLAEF